MSANSGWTDAQRDQIAQGLRDGLSASQIAGPLHVSRNAIIGVVHRDERLRAIGFRRKSGQMNFPTKQPQEVKVTKMPTKPAKIAVPALAALPASPQAVPSPFPVTTLELESTSCRYPVGHNRRGTMLFCGNKVPAGCGSWCEGHRRLVYATAA